MHAEKVARLDAELAKAYADYIAAHGKPNITHIAKSLGRDRTSVQGSLKRLARDGRLGTGAVLPGFAIKRTSEQRDESGAVQKTWVTQVPAGERFEVPEGHSVTGVSALLDASGSEIAKWVKTGRDSKQIIIDALLDIFKEYKGRAELPPKPKHSDDKLLTVYPIADVHLSMLAWGAETGASWDLDIAKTTLLGSIDHLISAAPNSHTAIILNLGDFLHTNDASNATPASGHKLDVDGRWRKIARVALSVHISLIEKALEKHEYVIAEYLPGNHDIDVSHVIAAALELFFANNPRVKIDSDPSDFFWYRHGQVLIGGNHGHKVKASELPGVMASYRSEDWGLTKHRYCYSGHLHHDRSGEKHGAKWEIFRTISAKDAYSHSHGYSAGRSMVSITHHTDRGEIMRHTVSI